MAPPNDKDESKIKPGDIALMIALGVVALGVVGGVVFAMTRKPELNEDLPDGGTQKRSKVTEKAPALDTKESDYDPQGRFSLDDAERAVPGSGAWNASIVTTRGTMTCTLFADRAPVTVANFVGLATGARAWKHPMTKKWVHRPAYDGTSFHRTIKGFMIQGGDPLGNGTGEPGYTIPDEMWGGRHDRAGLLCMANRGKDTNGAQFFIMDAPAAHIDGSYTIFGDCTPTSVVHDIASEPTEGDRPVKPVVIQAVKITRGG